jgi:hypothetical protein
MMPRGSNQPKQWTPEMVDRLRELVAARELSGSEIAGVIAKEFASTTNTLGLCVTRNSVAGQVHKYGLKLRAKQAGRKMIRHPNQTGRPFKPHKPREWPIVAMPEPEPMPEPPWTPPPPPPAPLPVEPEIDDTPDDEADAPIVAPNAALVAIYSVARADLRGHNNNPIRPPAMAGAFAKKDLPREWTKTAVGLFGLTTETCRWPIQDSPAYLFCGAQTLDKLPYCPIHFSRAKGIAPPRRGREFILP